MAVHTGTVGTHTRRTRRSGSPYVKASLVLDDGRALRCVWWDAGAAPPAGSRVDVEGRYQTYQGAEELHVDATTLHVPPSSSQSLAKRVLAYYRSCVEAEGAAEMRLPRAGAGERYVLLTSGADPGVSRGAGDSGALPLSPADRAWCDIQRARAHKGAVLVGWPVVHAAVEGTTCVVPLFFRRARLDPAGDALRLVVDAGEVELNTFALRELGVSHHERDEVMEEASQAMAAEATPADAVSAGLKALRTLGLELPLETLDPGRLRPLDVGAVASNAAVLFVAERGPTTANLMRDLQELARQPDAVLEESPLGRVLGLGRMPAWSEGGVAPTVVPSNLAQDRAVFAALANPLTVVTGPPGTGKSQVLVNAVSACLDSGQTVLFASKTNQAVDVVFERVAQVDPEAVLLRAGRSALRESLAVAVEGALQHPPASPADLEGVKARWRGLRKKVAELHAVPARRRRLTAEVAEDQAALEALQRRLPTGFADIADRNAVRPLLLEIRDHQDRIARYRDSFWPCVRGRIRGVEQAMGVAYELLVSALPASASAALATRPGQMDVPRLLDALGLAAQVNQARVAVEAKRAELAALPSDDEADDKLAALTAQRAAVGRQLFRAAWARCLSSPSHRSAGTQLASALRGRLAGTTSARQLLATVPGALRMFPAWGVSCLSARTNFPLEPGLFDLVIFDEASACDLASALPVLFRAKRVLVIGDPLQLSHITNLRAATDERLASQAGLRPEEHARVAYPSRSLYDAASGALATPPEFLSQHFRSRPRLIGFSNTTFYKGRLRLMRPEGPHQPTLRWVDVQGTFARRNGRSALNAAEVDAVVALLLQEGPAWQAAGLTVGVVSPFRAHVDRLAEALAAAEATLAEELEDAAPPRLSGDITIDTAHRYQGDERDVMIFSPVVSGDMPPNLRSFPAKPNLLNVALTRSREQIVVVGDRGACEASGGLLAKWVAYVGGASAAVG